MDNRFCSRSFALILFIFSFTLALRAQQPQVTFRTEGNGDTFTLYWGPEVWPRDLRGFMVKRKARGTDRWVTLSKNVITPATDDPVRLEYVTNSFAYQTELKQVYDSLVANKKIRVMTPEEMYDAFLSDQEKIPFLNFLCSVEFDFALVHGIAYVDRHIPEAPGYTYGIFPVYHSSGPATEPLHTADWTYGQKATITLEATGTVEPLGTTGLKPNWKLSVPELKAQEVVGFHIDVKGEEGVTERLTERPVRVNMSGTITDLFQLDKDRDPARSWTYQATPVSLFETEGTGLQAEWVPQESSD